MFELRGICLRRNVCGKTPFNPNIVVLQSRPGPHIKFYALKKDLRWVKVPCENHTIIIFISQIMSQSQ